MNEGQVRVSATSAIQWEVKHTLQPKIDLLGPDYICMHWKMNTTISGTIIIIIITTTAFNHSIWLIIQSIIIIIILS